MDSETRRQYLGTVVGSVALAGCISVGSEGTPDLLLRNCLDSEIDLDVTVTRVETDELVHEGRHAVGPDSCSDFGDPVEVADVFDHPGDYEVRASATNFDPTETTVTLLDPEVEDDSDSRTIRADEDGITTA